MTTAHNINASMIVYRGGYQTFDGRYRIDPISEHVSPKITQVTGWCLERIGESNFDDEDNPIVGVFPSYREARAALVRIYRKESV